MHPVSADKQHVETTRQIVHMLVALLALLLRWLTYPQALALALALVFFNAFLLPRLPGSMRFLYRTDERASGFSKGILAYPISVFLLILIFPVPVAAAMWAMLSLGDGAATLVGSRLGRVPLPWNPKKTFEGLLAFVMFALPAIMFFYIWTAVNMGSSPPWWRSEEAVAVFGALSPSWVWAFAMITSIACAFLESLDTKIDDNLLAPLGGAILLTALIHAIL